MIIIIIYLLVKGATAKSALYEKKNFKIDEEYIFFFGYTLFLTSSTISS
jgi:hypothetical protein